MTLDEVVPDESLAAEDAISILTLLSVKGIGPVRANSILRDLEQHEMSPSQLSQASSKQLLLATLTENQWKEFEASLAETPTIGWRASICRHTISADRPSSIPKRSSRKPWE